MVAVEAQDMKMQTARIVLAGHRLAVVIIVVGILLRLPLVFLPFDSLGYPWRPADTASIARNFAENGHNILYPQINWGGSGPGYVEAEFQLYPFIVSILYSLFGEHFWLGRLVSLAFTTLACAFFYALALRLFKKRVALWALAFFVIVPMYIRFSVEFMPEATDLFFYIAALYFFVRWLDEQKLAILVLAGVSTALAFLVKPTSINIGLVFLLLLLFKRGWRSLLKPEIWLFGFICLAPGVLWYLHARNLYLQYGNTFGVLSGGDSKFGNVLSYWLNPGFYFDTIGIDVKWVLAGTGIVAFVIGLVVYWRQRKSVLPLLPFGLVAIVIYHMALPRYMENASIGLQYHIFLLPYAALAVGLGFDWLFESFHGSIDWQNLMRSWRPLVGIVSIAGILIASGYYYRTLYRSYAATEVSCAKAMAEVIPANDRVIVNTTSTSLDDGFPNNYQNPVMLYYSHRFGWVLAIDQQTPAQVEALHNQGASYLVISTPALYDNNPALATYLGSQTLQVGPGLQNSCGIFRFS